MRWPYRRVLVTGPSMAPTLRHGDQLLVRRLPLTAVLRPGQVVVLHLPDRPLSVKRLRAVAESGALTVEGDNPLASTDSRELGPVPRDRVFGRVLVRLWPRPGRMPTTPEMA